MFPELNLGILELIEDLFNKHSLEALCRVSKPEQLYICDWFQKRGVGGKGKMKELGQVLQLLLINLAKQQMGNQQMSAFQAEIQSGSDNRKARLTGSGKLGGHRYKSTGGYRAQS